MTPVWILLLLQLRLTRQQVTNIYVQKGQDWLFPCGLVEPLSGSKEVTWSYNIGVSESSSVLLFRVAPGQGLKKEAAAREQLSVFPNHSLSLRGAEDGDTGVYWCSVQGANRRTYHLYVVTGTQTVLTTGHTNMTCHQFSCAISDQKALTEVTWWVDEQQVQSTSGQRAQGTGGQGWQLVLLNSRAALLHACWNRSDPGLREKKRRVKCELNSLEVSFNLTAMGAVKDPPAPNVGGPACSPAWIPLAVCAALEFLLLLALGAALWRRGRPAQRSHLSDPPAHTQPDPPGLKSQAQLYENVGLGYAGGADPAQPW